MMKDVTHRLQETPGAMLEVLYRSTAHAAEHEVTHKWRTGKNENAPMCEELGAHLGPIRRQRRWRIIQ